MSRPPISVTDLNETLVLSESHDGFWLYDETRGMNLSMRAKTRDGAFVEALTYYQDHLQKVENELKGIQTKVDAFIVQFTEAED